MYVKNGMLHSAWRVFFTVLGIWAAVYGTGVLIIFSIIKHNIMYSELLTKSGQTKLGAKTNETKTVTHNMIELRSDLGHSGKCKNGSYYARLKRHDVEDTSLNECKNICNKHAWCVAIETKRVKYDGNEAIRPHTKNECDLVVDVDTWYKKDMRFTPPLAKHSYGIQTIDGERFQTYCNAPERVLGAANYKCIYLRKSDTAPVSVVGRDGYNCYIKPDETKTVTENGHTCIQKCRMNPARSNAKRSCSTNGFVWKTTGETYYWDYCGNDGNDMNVNRAGQKVGTGGLSERAVTTLMETKIGAMKSMIDRQNAKLDTDIKRLERKITSMDNNIWSEKEITDLIDEKIEEYDDDDEN